MKYLGALLGTVLVGTLSLFAYQNKWFEEPKAEQEEEQSPQDDNETETSDEDVEEIYDGDDHTIHFEYEEKEKEE